MFDVLSFGNVGFLECLYRASPVESRLTNFNFCSLVRVNSINCNVVSMCEHFVE